jgi:hypothetical protein
MGRFGLNCSAWAIKGPFVARAMYSFSGKPAGGHLPSCWIDLLITNQKFVWSYGSASAIGGDASTFRNRTIQRLLARHGRTRRGRTSAARQSIPTRKLERSAWAFEVDGPTGQNAANGLYQFESSPLLPLPFASFNRRGFLFLETCPIKPDLSVRSRTCAWY